MRPIVLIFGGLDPTGGAGLAADVEAVFQTGARGAPVATAVTAQDTVGVFRITPVMADMIRAQAEAVIRDLPVAVIKIGMLATVAALEVVAEIASQLPGCPMVLDPVLASGRGDTLACEPLAEALRSDLCPRATVITPNHAELARLVPGLAPARAVEALLSEGQTLFLKGADLDTAEVLHEAYRRGPTGMDVTHYRWPRLPGQYHGSGCTLASALAASLALGASVPEALEHAQRYAFETLKAADRPGQGQALPDRAGGR